MAPAIEAPTHPKAVVRAGPSNFGHGGGFFVVRAVGPQRATLNAYPASS